jgi:signal transduction histidine kinase
VAVVTATSQAGGVPGDVGSALIWLVIVAVNLGVAGGMMWLAANAMRQEAERERAIAELTELNGRLEATLRENAGLHAQLVTQAREAGILDERQRMAREIHDTLAQGLTGIVTQLQAADSAGPASDEWRRHIDAAMQLARDSLTEARRSVQAMRPEALEGARLPDALSEVARGWSERTDVRADVATTGVVRAIPADVEVALLRTAQEALANVEKHAGASRVGLTLSYMDDLVTLDVRDDGVGFDAEADTEASADGGYGLLAIRQRLERLAGSLAIESEPGGGTALSASMPAVRVGGAV